MHDADNQSTQKMTVFPVSYGQKPYLVEARAVVCGNCISVTVGGGTHYHIGAAALGIPRPSLADEEKISASASVICVTGHKEDELARQAALSIASSLGCIVCVAVGIHIDHAAPEDIEKLITNFKQVLKSLIKVLQEHL